MEHEAESAPSTRIHNPRSSLGDANLGLYGHANESPFPYYAIPQFHIYVPSSMLQNTVPQSDCQYVVHALNWLKNHMGENSVLLTHTAFHGWALLTHNMNQVVPYGYGNPGKGS